MIMESMEMKERRKGSRRRRKRRAAARRRNKQCMYICERYAPSAEKGLSQPFAGPCRMLKHIEAKPIKNECHTIITFTLKM